MLVGPLVDKVGRMKPFVLVSGIVAAAALTIPMMWPTEGGMLGYNIVGGVAFGVYMAVDMALITKALPRTEDAGKDLGVINIANAGPQILAPTVAGWIVTQFGYGALFPVAAVISLIGAGRCCASAASTDLRRGGAPRGHESPIRRWPGSPSQAVGGAAGTSIAPARRARARTGHGHRTTRGRASGWFGGPPSPRGGSAARGGSAVRPGRWPGRWCSDGRFRGGQPGGGGRRGAGR
ncbi:hypothetical protein ABIA32_003079 [Streptacidiphilus sp. MAP12-20]